RLASHNNGLSVAQHSGLHTPKLPSAHSLARAQGRAYAFHCSLRPNHVKRTTEIVMIARLESIVRDLRYAIRSLKSRPAFTLTVIATLALGIGANAAIFTLVDALLLRPLPVSHPEQLVIVGDPAAVNNNNVGSPVTDYVSFLLYRDVRARNTVFTDMYASGGPVRSTCRWARAVPQPLNSRAHDS